VDVERLSALQPLKSARRCPAQSIHNVHVASALSYAEDNLDLLNWTPSIPATPQQSSVNRTPSPRLVTRCHQCQTTHPEERYPLVPPFGAAWPLCPYFLCNNHNVPLCAHKARHNFYPLRISRIVSAICNATKDSRIRCIQGEVCYLLHRVNGSSPSGQMISI
jgi:hypothetical protein